MNERTIIIVAGVLAVVVVGYFLLRSPTLPDALAMVPIGSPPPVPPPQAPPNAGPASEARTGRGHF